MRPYKPRSSVAADVTCKRTLTAKSVEHRSKFAALSPAMVKAAR
jgi:hypothetical protein